MSLAAGCAPVFCLAPIGRFSIKFGAAHRLLLGSPVGKILLLFQSATLMNGLAFGICFWDGPNVEAQSSVELDDGFAALLSLEAGFSALLSPPDFSLPVERPWPEGER